MDNVLSVLLLKVWRVLRDRPIVGLYAFAILLSAILTSFWVLPLALTVLLVGLTAWDIWWMDGHRILSLRRRLELRRQRNKVKDLWPGLMADLGLVKVVERPLGDTFLRPQIRRVDLS